jgi:hypothetical protein
MTALALMVQEVNAQWYELYVRALLPMLYMGEWAKMKNRARIEAARSDLP